MKKEFEFRCAACGEIHQGMPSFGADRPLSYYQIPEGERATRCRAGFDECIIDDKWFFVRGCLDIPVHGESEPLVWGVWVSLGERSYRECLDAFERKNRSHLGPFFGWLNAWLKPYPDTMNLKVKLHLLDDGVRPYVELEPTDHPLAVEQRTGISTERVAELYSVMVHQ